MKTAPFSFKMLQKIICMQIRVILKIYIGLIQVNVNICHEVKQILALFWIKFKYMLKILNDLFKNNIALTSSEKDNFNILVMQFILFMKIQTGN